MNRYSNTDSLEFWKDGTGEIMEISMEISKQVMEGVFNDEMTESKIDNKKTLKHIS